MNTKVGLLDSDFSQERRNLAPLAEMASNVISKRIGQYCLGRLARDLEVRNGLKNIENNVEHPSASACAADVSIQLERLES